MHLKEQSTKPKYYNEWHRLRVNLLATTSWMSNEIRNFLEPFGITQKQFNILRILRGQSPDSITMQDVRARMIDKMSDASRIIDRLIKKGLVEKKPCTIDKRSNRVLITKKGLELLTTIDHNIGQLDAVTQNLSIDQARQLNELLESLR